ncbi:hypothetical protein [Acidisoma cladoniae]|jgi:hypothetical protein|uniref:hypothetical protein n=1 Tax=Acidisoma cladoniae TaxID=3040935 RepID=UPI00254CA010|nr:hypothetical protein [Acidisoma sp. PAMC 29798]
MTIPEPGPAPAAAETLDSLRERAAQLEQQVRSLSEQSRTQLLMAELKTEAVRAGIVDLDGLRLVDTTTLQVNERGEVTGASALMEHFKRQKPWLFGSASSSPTAAPPPSQPARRKQAVDMSHDEYRAARAALLRRV